MDQSLKQHLARIYPGARIDSIEPLAVDTSARDATAKAIGYGAPVRVALTSASGEPMTIVFRTAAANELGHDRRSDRAAEILQAYDDFRAIPNHVEPVDVGAVSTTGELISLRETDELYLITRYAKGTLYADELRAIASAGRASERDHARVDVLARYLATLHVPLDNPVRYRRAIRDLVGSGEGIFGVVDSYPPDVASALHGRLASIEQRCAEWRWMLREHEGRLCRTHGDFHPFNLLFDDDRLVVLDASRGACGDPADDLAALAVNYVLFALDTEGSWRAFGPLWHRLWQVYEEQRADSSLRAVFPAFFAWRALVVCNPAFYPNLSTAARTSLLDLVDVSLTARRFDPSWADELFK